MLYPTLPRKYDRGIALVLAVVLAAATAPSRAAAAFITTISPGSANLAVGGSQQFTVYLASDNPLVTDVAGFTVRLELAGAVAGVYFSGGAMPATGYVFQGNSGGFGAVLGPQNPGDLFPPGSLARSITLTDFPNDPPYTVGLSGPGSWVLGVVTVTADASSPGGAMQLRFNQSYSGLDGTVTPLEVSFGSGASLQVQTSPGALPVPEPGGFVLFAMTFPFLMDRVRRGARRVDHVNATETAA